MRKYDAAVFDVDGTLLNTRDGVLSAVRAMLKECGLGELPVEKEHLFIGPPIQRSLKDVYGVSPEEAQACAEVFRNLYKSHEYLLRAEVYDGILKLMKDLKELGIRSAVATYKREDYAIDICRHFGITEYADVVHGADNFNKLTKSDIIKLCMQDMGIEPARAVMVGDSDNDAIGAEGIGCPFIGVTYGFGFRTAEDVRKYPCIHVAETPAGILVPFAEQ